MFKRKIRKFFRDPKLFFKDMAVKHKGKYTPLLYRRRTKDIKYTVISAVYNVSKYLDEYFSSLTKQRLGFKSNIHVIVVDDGSTDNSAEIIKSWIKKFPDNITYIYKENGGQASARNLGLQYAKTEWVTYIDPDDFVDKCYFENIDKVIDNNRNISMVSCNFIFYYENSKRISNTHPLKHRFIDNNKKKIFNMGSMLQMHVNSVFFKKSIILKGNVVFDGRLRPNFEDGHFVAQYMEHCKNDFIYFCKDAIYFYRKREDSTSALDTSWSKVGKFSDVLEYGYLELLERYSSKYNKIPQSIQWTIIYEMIWHFKHLLQKPERASFLTDTQKLRYLTLVFSIFKYIETKEIMKFNLAGAWFYHKLGIISAFKKEKPPIQIVYIDAFDHAKKLIKLRYFIANETEAHTIFINNKPVTPVVSKIVKHDFIDVDFCKEVISWIRIDEGSKYLHAIISDVPTRISFEGKNHIGALSIGAITSFFSDNEIKLVDEAVISNSKYKDCWVFMDKDISADDNAEHFYRYINKNHPDINSYFVLSKNSKDWGRLHSEGFKLIRFGSKEHHKALINCKKLISSHADHYVTNYLGNDMLKGKHFVFLQHGVIKDDLSSWLNTKEQIDLFVTTSEEEYLSICGQNTRYKFTEKEVVLTGLPRHDALIKRKKETKRQVLIMPTWRRNLLANRSFKTSIFEERDDFTETTYFKYWNDLLSSGRLEYLSNKYKFEIVFLPHSYILPYLQHFTPNKKVMTIKSNARYQDLFSESAIMITDYSSVAFDMAIQNKPTIYFQFDEDEFYSGTHNYTKGYFDYHQHGFGPVVYEVNDVINNIESFFSRKMKVDSSLSKRISNFSKLGDGKSCQRVLEEIIKLDRI